MQQNWRSKHSARFSRCLRVGGDMFDHAQRPRLALAPWTRDLSRSGHLKFTQVGGIAYGDVTGPVGGAL